MPRNGSGVMSIPNTLVDQTTITAGAHNTNYTDIASEISNSVAVDGQSQMSGQFKFASGTVGAPGLVPGSDLDTGVYRIGGDNLGVACAGAKVLDIGTLGLGVTGTLSASGALSAASLAITADLPISEGGTGQSTATAAFSALSPVTTRGDLIKRGASNNERLAIGAADTVLKSDGTDPAYGRSSPPTSPTACLPMPSSPAALRPPRRTWKRHRQRTCLSRPVGSTSTLATPRRAET